MKFVTIAVIPIFAASLFAQERTRSETTTTTTIERESDANLAFDVRYHNDRGKLVVAERGLNFEDVSDAKHSALPATASTLGAFPGRSGRGMVAHGNVGVELGGLAGGRWEHDDEVAGTAFGEVEVEAHLGPRGESLRWHLALQDPG